VTLFIINMTNNLIDINEVSKIFGKTVNHMRNYKNLGIIEPKTKNGNKELYSKKDVLFCKKLFNENITNMKLSQIGKTIQTALSERKT
jgi:DNA-binding transcriptional MerR regulator